MARGKKTGGRKPGSPNKFSRDLKQAILEAAEKAGEAHGKEGTVSYLQWAAKEHPAPFIGLLGKVLPMQLTGDPNNPVRIIFETVYEQKAT